MGNFVVAEEKNIACRNLIDKIGQLRNDQVYGAGRGGGGGGGREGRVGGSLIWGISKIRKTVSINGRTCFIRWQSWQRCLLIASHLSPLILEVVGTPQMTLQQYLSILPCLPLPSGNLQTPFPSILWCYLPISSSVFLSFLLHLLALAELSSPCQRILRCGHTIWVSVSLPWSGDHHALQLHSGFRCEPPRSSHGLCRKCSEVSYSISSQGLGSFSRFLLSRSSSHRLKGRQIRWASASA